MTKINPESFAQAVVASHSNQSINDQLKAYVAAYELAEKHNRDSRKQNPTKVQTFNVGL